jgi:heavy metal translocating P-type ATPase
MGTTFTCHSDRESELGPAKRWHLPALSKQKERYIAVLASVGILVHLILRYGVGAGAPLARLPLLAVLLVGGAPLLYDLVRKALARQFGSDLLAGMSIVAAFLMGQHLVASIVVLMLSGGAALEQYASQKASSVLGALARRMPHTAHRKTNSGFEDVSLDAIAVGDTLVVFPHEICPTDGVVLDGHGVMDEAYLTGEPFRISKAPGAPVLSGSVNGETALSIQATQLPEDSRYAKIIQVMQASEQNRPHLRRLGDQLGAWYTPAAAALAALAWLASGDPRRFLAVLVIATPCPLLISIPVAIIGAISLAARHAIIIKNPAILEQLDRCRTLIFDKTGTLTYGRPTLTEVAIRPGIIRADALGTAASLEQYSKHPLAAAIIRAAQDEGVKIEPAAEVHERPGEGLRGVVGNHRIQIRGRSHDIPELPAAAGGLECVLLIDGVYSALFRFRDAPRQESGAFLDHLRPRHRVNRVMLLSGDRESEVRYLAEAVGISEMHFAKSPEEKVGIVREEAQRGKTLFVGDGINDAPALLAATVGVAFGQNSDITSEAADAVIMEASLTRVDELIHIGQRMRFIALECALGGMALSLLGMALAAVGWLPPLAGAVAQEVIDLAAVLNALRVAIPVNLTDF